MKELKALFRKNTMLITIVVVFAFFNVLTRGRMIYAQNLSNLLLQNGYVIILACGMLMCILTGGNVDLSVGCTVCLSGAIVAVLLQKTSLSVIIICAIAIAASVVVGLWNGYLIGYVKIPPFVVTLGSMFIVRGLAREILDSKTVAVHNSKFINTFVSYIHIKGLDDGLIKYSAIILGVICCLLIVFFKLKSHNDNKKQHINDDFDASKTLSLITICLCILTYCWKLANCNGIPIMILWVLGVVLIYSFITMRSVIGRHFYATGGNAKATKLSGIKTEKIMFNAYLQMAVLAGLCGLICAARIGSVNGDTGTQFEMDAIGSCFIGGASAYGGSGTILGAIIGAVLMGIINQGMSIYGLSTNWQYVVKGLVLLTAVVFDIRARRRRAL